MGMIHFLQETKSEVIKIKNLLCLIPLILFSIVSHAEYYKVYIKRVDSNLYKTDSGLHIKTKYCYEYSYGEEAILKYESYSYDNKLIFDSGSTCDVEKIFK